MKARFRAVALSNYCSCNQIKYTLTVPFERYFLIWATHQYVGGNQIRTKRKISALIFTYCCTDVHFCLSDDLSFSLAMPLHPSLSAGPG